MGNCVSGCSSAAVRVHCAFVAKYTCDPQILRPIGVALPAHGPSVIPAIGSLLIMVGSLVGVALNLFRLALTGVYSHTQLAAENLFLRKQLALYLAR
jgi:hypothetical protein